MTLNLMPITGIPLPFFSYGGTFMLASWLAIGILVRISAEGRGGRSGPVRGLDLHARRAAPASSIPCPLPVTSVTLPRMAWFRKEKKPRQPRRERLEIPADVWEKCEACGHTDIREKFVRNFNVCPNCDYHRRIRADEYCRHPAR